MTREEAVSKFRSVKAFARNKVTGALASGRLSRAAYCSQCGSRKNIEGHHEDYEAPLLVEWLCRHCHRIRHSRRHFKTANDVLNGACHCGCTYCFARTEERQRIGKREQIGLRRPGPRLKLRTRLRTEKFPRELDRGPYQYPVRIFLVTGNLLVYPPCLWTPKTTPSAQTPPQPPPRHPRNRFQKMRRTRRGRRLKMLWELPGRWIIPKYGWMSMSGLASIAA
jgi:hypothetical protein